MFWLPVSGPISIHVITTWTVFVDSAITIIVDSFTPSHGPLSILHRSVRTKFCRNAFENARIACISAMRTLRIFSPHLSDGTIAVEIIWSIFIADPISIIIRGLHSSSRRVRTILLVEPVRASIWIDCRKKIESASIDEFRQCRNFSVRLAEIVHGIHDCFSRLDFISMNVAINPHRRLGSICASRWIIENDDN